MLVAEILNNLRQGYSNTNEILDSSFIEDEPEEPVMVPFIFTAIDAFTTVWSQTKLSSLLAPDRHRSSELSIFEPLFLFHIRLFGCSTNNSNMLRLKIHQIQVGQLVIVAIYES